MKKIILLISFYLIAVFGIDGQTLNQTIQLSIGNKWIYHMGGKLSGVVSDNYINIIIEITKKEISDDNTEWFFSKTLFRAKDREYSALDSECWTMFYIDGNTYWAVEYGENAFGKYALKELELKEPLEIGTSWKSYKGRYGEEDCSIVDSNVNILILENIFTNCFVVRRESPLDKSGKKMIRYCFYCPGIGFIGEKSIFTKDAKNVNYKDIKTWIVYLAEWNI